MSLLINLKSITKLFSTETVETAAVREVSLSVEEGDFVAIMGPSGCGKSTLLNILGMIDTSTSGSYFYDGIELGDASVKRLAEVRKKNVGFVFQSFNLIEELTVFENVELGVYYQGYPKSLRRKMVEDVLARLAISHRASHRPSQLSGGQQQRVAVGRAIVGNQKLLLADEPTGNLDSKNGEEVMNLLQEVNQSGTTVIMVTHSDEQAKFANVTFNMLDGRIVVAA
jgi:putative ABC transport system ATP-binding protein